jgi:phospholipase/carboxylesterase
MHTNHILSAGKELKSAEKVLIMIHGRGGRAEDILTLSGHLNVEDFALIAPQANNNTWYPFSFLAPPDQNQPGLDSALSVLKNVVDDLVKSGKKTENIYFLGFSQGACLTLEFTTRHATRYGGIVAFTGGLIGDKIYRDNYAGDFNGTPVFIGSADPDFHVPVERVYATTNILKEMNAVVTEKIYPGMGHTISMEEIELVNSLIF